MTLKFNMLLTGDGIDPIAPSEVVLLRHQDSRAVRGRSPYEMWRDDRAAWNVYQTHQTFGDRTTLSRPKYWASFVGTPDGRTMFVGLHSVVYAGVTSVDVPWPYAEGVDLAGTIDRYDLTVVDRLSDLIGKLFIEWGPGTRAWIQRADNLNKPIVEVRPEFREPEFPGFLRLVASLSQVSAFPISWSERLAEARGVYLLTCPRTKEQYVGSATGGRGFIGRWEQYVLTGHGENVALKSREPADYQVSILEVAGSAAMVEDILGMETLWKMKLQSREMGLNRN